MFFRAVMTPWTPDDQYRFDLGFALRNVTVRGLRRLLVEAERERIAATIFDHLRLCRWQWSHSEAPIEPAYLRHADRSDGTPE